MTVRPASGRRRSGIRRLMKLNTLLLTLALWLTLASPALAKSTAYNAGKIFGYLFIPAVLLLGIFLLVRRTRRRD